MTISIRDALDNLPILSSARVAAGEGGLWHAIRWTHIVDQPEVFSWVREGDLLVTTAFALRDNLTSELGMVEQMAQKGLAGMLVSIGRYINAVPESMLAAANALDFPIVVIPWEIPLVEVTHAIHERIIREQYQVTEQLYHIHDVLSQLVLEGGGLAQLAGRLSELLQCSVAIEDENFRLQACSRFDPEDEARRRTLDGAVTPPEIQAYLAESGILEKMKSDPHPQRIQPIPHIGLRLERMLAPILVGPDLYGYIWIIASQRPFDQLDVQAVERAAHIAALILTRERSIFAAEQRVKAGLIENLLDPLGTQNPYALQEILRQFGLHGGCSVVVAEDPAASLSTPEALVRMAEQVQTDMGASGAAVEWNGRLLWMINPAAGDSAEQLARKLAERWNSRGGKLSAGISAPVSSAPISSAPTSGVTELRAAYQQAFQALQIGLSLSDGQTGVWSFERLGYLAWLNNLPAGLKAANPYARLVKEIAAYDADHSTAYLATLEASLQNQFNHSRTAQALFIHRNSLLKRLDRIQELWGIDFQDSQALLNLHLAILERKLNSLD